MADDVQAITELQESILYSGSDVDTEHDELIKQNTIMLSALEQIESLARWYTDDQSMYGIARDAIAQVKEVDQR